MFMTLLKPLGLQARLLMDMFLCVRFTTVYPRYVYVYVQARVLQPPHADPLWRAQNPRSTLVHESVIVHAEQVVWRCRSQLGRVVRRSRCLRQGREKGQVNIEEFASVRE